MIDRAIAILEAVKGEPVGIDMANRIIAAFLPDDCTKMTEEQKASYFVREIRWRIKLRLQRHEESLAAEKAMQEARDDIEDAIDLGID
jgi:hypothetical protein